MTDLRARLSRVMALCDPVPDAFLFESGGHGVSDGNFYYVTGSASGALSGATVILRPGERPEMIVSAMEAESAGRASEVEVVVVRSRREHDQVLADGLQSYSRIGYNPHGLTAARFRALSQALPGASWVDVSAPFARARAVKEPGEIARIRDACRITADTLGDVRGLLAEGLRERDLAAEVTLRMQKRGADSTAFDTIVAFGPSASEPHHIPGDAALAPGSLVLVDLGARRRGYASDCTRTLAFGRVGKSERRMHGVVTAAQDAALEGLVPGRPAREVHEAAERVIGESEFRDRFVHAVGHSVGIEAQDGWVLHAHAEFVIEPGMVFAVEPGVYIPGAGGVRVEDTVLVTESGPERLTDAGRSLEG
jgi:Xaa-Pro dipeptidase